MPQVPKLQILYRRADDILFGWSPLLRSEATSYNLYASPASAGVYTAVKIKIPNEPDKSVYQGKVVAVVKDSDIPIPPNEFVPPKQGGVVRGTTWWFKLTFVDPTNVESNIALSPAIVVWAPNVEPFFENEDEVRNNHGFAWIESRHRWEKLLLTDDGRLQTDATFSGSITIGNVKVAARPDGTTLEYLLVDSNREIIARLDPNSISRISDYEESAAFAKNVETIILTYTNAQAYFVEKISCSGTGDAEFRFKIDGTTSQILRSSWNNRNPLFDFSASTRKISAGSTVTVTAKHIEKANQSFECSLMGFTFVIV